MIFDNVRIDWCFCFEPGGKGKYGVCVMLPKGSKQHKQAQEGVDKAIKAGIANGKFTEAQTKSTSFKKCLRDGDEEFATGERPVHYKGHMFFNANNAKQPGIVGPDAKPLMDANQLYSGCFSHVDVGFYPFNNESKGVGAGLNNIMKYKDGERLDGRQSAEEAFAGFATEDADNLQ